MCSGGATGGGGTLSPRAQAILEGSGGSTGGGPSPAAELESKVQELQRQVAEELEALTKHQEALGARARLGSSSFGADSEAGAAIGTSGSELEKAVERLSRQVCEELKELEEHQGGLQKVRAAVTALAERTGTTEVAPASVRKEGDLGGIASRSLEAKAEELSQQVMAELQALTGQQKELGEAKITLADFAQQLKEVLGRVSDCQKATQDLGRRFEELEGGKSGGVTKSSGGGSTSPSGGGIKPKGVSLAPLSTANTAGRVLAPLSTASTAGSGAALGGSASSRAPALGGGASAPAREVESDGSESYEEDAFDESLNEESVSG